MSVTIENPDEATKKRRYDLDEIVLLYQIRRSTGWMAFFTMVIAVGFAAAAFFSYQNLEVAQNQLDLMDDQSEQVQKLTTSLTKTVEDLSSLIRQGIDAANHRDAAELALAEIATKGQSALSRPWVGTEFVTAGILTANQNLNLKAVIRNSGRSPAFNVRAFLYAAVPAVKDIAIPDIAECADCLQPIILPSGVLNYNVTVSADVLTKDKTDGIRNGTDVILLLGRIDYVDSLMESHTTSICLTYVPKSGSFSACDHGNALS